MTELLEQTRFGYGQNDKGFHVGTKPWYAVGTELVNKAPSIEEAINLSGLNWEVQLKDLQTDEGIKTPYKGVMRMDNNTCLGAVTSNYKPLQNIEAFNFFQEFVDNDLASLDSAGSFLNGRRTWILAKINSNDMVIDEKHDDRVEKYILLSNSHDGKTAIRIGYTPIRISCMNTLVAAHKSTASQLIKVYHRGNIVKTIYSIQETMNLLNQTFMATEEQYKELAKKPVNVATLEKYINVVFSKDSLEKLLKDETGFSQFDIEESRRKLMDRVEEVFEMEYAHNAWTAYNAVNNYICHDRGKTQESGLNALWFESGQRLNQRAFELAKKL